MTKRIVVTSFLIVFIFTVLVVYYAAIAHAQGPWTLTVVSDHDAPNPPVGINSYNDGESVTCNVSNPVIENDVSYTCTGWTGTGSVPPNGSDAFVTFTISQDSNITWNWKITQWTLTVTSAHGSPSPAVGDHSYDDGSSVTCNVTSPVTEGNITYTCNGWSGTGSVPTTGSGTSVDFTISQNSTIMWIWQVVQHELTVVSAHDSPNPPVGINSYNDGESVTCNVSSPVIENDVSYTCTGWTGTGDVPPSGSDTSVTFTISQNSSITWNWKITQRTLTVTSAHDSPNPPVGNHTYDDGTLVTCSVSSPVVEDGVSYTCTGWTGTGSVPASGSDTSVSFTISQDSNITWNWKITQRTLTVTSAYGSPSPGIGDHLYNDGSSVTCNVSSPVVDGGVSYTCKGWTGTGSAPANGIGTTVTFTISQNSTVTWNWQVSQWTLTVVSAHGSPNPPVGIHTYNDITLVTCNVSSPVKEGRIIYTCTGWTGTGSVPSSGSGTSVTFAISQNSTITWNWHGNAVQFNLTVTSAHDNPSPAVGDHLYDDGSSVTCSVTSPITEGNLTYTCTGWSGTGSVPTTGLGTSVTFTISQNSSITWNWRIAQWTLTVTSAHGNPSPAVGNNLYDDGSSVTCNVSSPVIEAGVSYTCMGWVGTGSVPVSGGNISVTFRVSQNSSITWNWTVTPPVQWTLTVTSAHGNPIPSVGDHPYDNGSSVTCNVSSPVIDGGVSYTCTGWTGTGSAPANGFGTSVTFTISQDSTVTWIWQGAQRKLTVMSAHGSSNPSVGDHAYNNGTLVTCSVTSPVTDAGQIWTCTGWGGTGSVPASGGGVSVTFRVTENSSITWNWQTHRGTIESRDSTDAQRDVFTLGETICIVGSDFGINQTYNVYVVYDTVWFDGVNISGRVQVATTSSDFLGNISLTAVWNKPSASGIYDILVDVNGNGKYDAGVDALYSKVIVAAGDRMPTFLTLAGCFAALGAFLVYKRRHH